MNILYCGDKNIEKGLLISILSLLKNVEEPINIYVLTMKLKNEQKSYYSVSDNFINYLDNLVKKNNKDNFVRKIDITSLFLNDLPKANLDTRFTPYCMLRLFADEISELPDRLLYLDNDVICRKDCSEFYYQDITNDELAGVLDYYGKWFFRNNIFKMDYINSGVLLLNLKKLKSLISLKNAEICAKIKKCLCQIKLPLINCVLIKKFNQDSLMSKENYIVIQYFNISQPVLGFFLGYIH